MLGFDMFGQLISLLTVKVNCEMLEMFVLIWKIGFKTQNFFSAYLKGLSKYRMAFFFLKIFFCFRAIDVFLLCKLDQR